MKVTINGSEEQFDRPCSIRDILQERNLSSSPCAVEINGQVIPKAKHETHSLADGDRIEIVTLVGGG